MMHLFRRGHLGQALMHLPHNMQVMRKVYPYHDGIMCMFILADKTHYVTSKCMYACHWLSSNTMMYENMNKH